MSDERTFEVVVTVPCPSRPDGDRARGYDRDLTHLLEKGPIAYTGMSVAQDRRGNLRFTGRITLTRRYDGLRYRGDSAYDAIDSVGRAVEFEVGRLVVDAFDAPPLDTLTARARLVPTSHGTAATAENQEEGST